MKDKTLHMIGNAHLDPVWLWRWQEGFAETKATFRSALDRIAESEDFIFTCSSAQAYEWVENSDPAMFAEIKQRVAEGRWQIVGGWWTQPDCNIPSGESLVRQGLYGQKYFMAKFGVAAKGGYNVDSFGHTGSLPQILKKSGLDYYVFMRPMPGEKALPSRAFRWESEDGSSVLAFRILFEYLTWGKEVDVHVQRCMGEMKDPTEEIMVFYGVGNHGGGPTIENIESIRRLNKDKNFPRLIFSHPQKYFEAMEAKQLALPVVQGDLQHHASGCYAANSAVKAQNRQTENALITAEKFSAAAYALNGQPYPNLAQGWKNLLFNQFHDILAGCSLESAYQDTSWQLGESMAMAERAKNYALSSFAWNINIEKDTDMHPYVVFNPCPWATNSCVELETTEIKEGAVLCDETGVNVAFQHAQPHAACNGRSRISFMADLPAMGWRVFKLYAAGKKSKKFPSMPAEEFSAENPWYRLTLNPATGAIASLFDKEKQAEVFRGDAAVAKVIHDDSDTWSHDVLTFQNFIGEFQLDKIIRLENGPVRTVLRVISTYNSSRLVQDFIVYAGKKQIDVLVNIDWREHQKAVKLLFPVNVMFNRNSYETPYGFIEREGNGEEEPHQNWVDVSGLMPGSGKGYTHGVAIVNNCKYSTSVVKDVIGFTLLRSPIFAHHTPYVPSSELEYSYIDNGRQKFSYSIVPHLGNWEDIQLPRIGWELNNPPIIMAETFHAGALEQKHSLLECESPNIVVTVFKLAEDSADYILRAYESTKQQTNAVIHVHCLGRTIETTFTPCEIKTFLIPADASQPVVQTNLLEEVVG